MAKITKQQMQLAQTIDKWVQSIEEQGGGDIEILQGSYSQLATFKELLDTTKDEQMDILCEMYNGFYRFAKLAEIIAQGIQDGIIEVPKE